MRKIQFQTDEYYHIYNRGVDKRKIFMEDKDYIRFLTGMREFNQLTLVESLRRLSQIRRQATKVKTGTRCLSVALVSIICYCLNPNHYHFILKQLTNNGISKFMHKIGMGYTNYFNKKYNRSGVLLQGKYKAAHIKTDDQLFQISCYINGNPEIHKINKADKWPWSSYQDYLDLRNNKLCDKNIILKDFPNIEEYKKLSDIIIQDSMEKKEDLKKVALE